ncbi:SM-like, degradation of cytoplasmic mRNAs and positively regulates transcription initiation [Gaertneriomyces sp. JEL0708]|nr:SM-like, degradation of cytoplasmic mRNAs and positively regulates transcription initiation [Gaertneriomyces sp. JEL0708]
MDNFLPGSASLVDCVDKKLLVILRDNRKLIGWLRSYDQFANLVLQDTIERTYVGDTFADVYRGIFLVRGENVVLLGEIDKQKEQEQLSKHLKPAPIEEVKAMYDAEMKVRKSREQTKARLLRDRGFSIDVQENDQY